MYGPKMFDLFYLFDFLRWEQVPNPMKWLPARVICDSIISAILAGVSVMSWK
jgi:hypothetical protein